MPLPSTGWLSSNTNQSPELFLLPVEDEFFYIDGIEGELSDLHLTVNTKAVGILGTTEEVYAAGSEIGFKAAIQKRAVYTALLIDSILVPAFEFEVEDPVEVPFEEDQKTYLDILSYESCCVADLGWFYNGAYEYDGSKKAGIP